jgi:hypothetical protein
MEVEVRRDVLVMVMGLMLFTLLGMIGYFVSPRNDDGRPVLLSPEVRAVEQYRRLVSGWAADWRAVDATMQGTLKTNDGDKLLSISQDAQRSFDQAVSIAQEVDATTSPASLIGLHDQATLTAQTYVSANLAVARWVSAPSAENRSAAEQALAEASDKLAALEANEWIRAKGGG